MATNVPLIVLQESVLEAQPRLFASDGDKVRNLLGPGTFLLAHVETERLVIPPLPVPTFSTAPVIASPALVGGAASWTNAVWNAAPQGLTIQTEGRTLVGGAVRDVALGSQWQAVDSGLPAIRQERARFLRARPGVAPEEGAWTEWEECQSAPVTIGLPAPTFTAQPTFGAASYTVGQTLSMNLGAAGPNATLTIELFTLNGATRVSELSPTGTTRTWDSTGETAGTVSLRVRATNSGGFVLSNTITVPLNAAAAALLVREVPGEAVIDFDGTGTIDVTVSGAPGFGGTYSVNTALLASGMIAAVAPRIEILTDTGDAGISVGDVIGLAAPFGANDTPGLIIFDPTRGAVTASWVWQRDVNGNGVFADIAGAPPSESRAVAQADAGHRVRLVRRAVQAGVTLNNPSNAIAIPGASSLTVTGATDGIVFDSPAAITVSAETDGIIVQEA